MSTEHPLGREDRGLVKLTGAVTVLKNAQEFEGIPGRGNLLMDVCFTVISRSPS